MTPDDDTRATLGHSALSLPVAVTQGRRVALVALRDRLAAAAAEAGARELAALAKQLADVLRELDSLPDEAEEGSVVDDLTTRRSRRRAAAAGQ